MAAERPFPPSARRLALARAAGLTPASPIVVGAAACAAAVIALAATGAAMATRLHSWVRDAVGAADGRATRALHDATAATGAGDTFATTFDARALVTAVAALALPVLGATALAALAAHLALTRAVWIPRRTVDGAPAEDPRRGTHGALGIASAAVVGAVAVGWLYAMAPRLAALPLAPRAGVLLVASFVAALAVAWVAAGAVDALVRYAAHTAALRMTPEERRADARLAGADPRWRARREKLARGEPAREAVAGASVLVLGDGVAVAVAWDPVRRPVPVRTAVGRAARATQLLGLARRHAIAVHRDAELALLLATGDGPVPELHWPRLAEVIAATRRR